MTFTVTMNVARSMAVNITYTTADGTATLADNDYTQHTATVVTIPAGLAGQTATFTVATTADTKVEANETFGVTVSSADANFNGTDATGTGTITNDDTATVSIAKTTDGNEAGPVNGVFTVTQTKASSTDTVLSYSVGGTATSGLDYTALSGTVTISAGTTTATITVPVINDAIVEATETVILTIAKSSGNAGVTVGTNNATLTIADNDYFLTISNPGTGSGWVTVSTGGVSRGTIYLAAGSTSDPIGVNAGDSVVLSGETPAIAPDPGSVFKAYSENSFAMPAADKGVTATFNQQWRITAGAGANGTIAPSGTVIVEQGDSSPSYTITPNDGYFFELNDNGSLIITYGFEYTYPSFVVTMNHDIVVTFFANPKITPSHGANGTISPDTVQTVNYGVNSTTFTMSPDVGYCVDDVTVNGASEGEITSRTFTNITYDQTIYVAFRQNYIFTGSIEPFMARAVWGGSGKWRVLKKSDGTAISGWLDHQDTVILSECSINDFTFEIQAQSGWTRVDTDGLIDFSTPGTTALTAEYKPNLTTAASGFGAVTPAATAQARTFNELVTLTATPNLGFKFARWEGSVTGTTNPTSVAMNEPRTVTAIFISEGAADIDSDGDGYSVNQGDCNDSNANIHPGAVEICGNDVDEDCTGADLPCALEKICLDISDVPLDTQLQAAPANIMFVIDDSGSMDWEFMTTETEGIFGGNYYIFDDPGGDNNYGNILTASGRAQWKSQWHGYNKMYYKPSINYTPWPGLTDANPDNPKTDPTKSYTLSMGATFLPRSSVGSSPAPIASSLIIRIRAPGMRSLLTTALPVGHRPVLGATRWIGLLWNAIRIRH